MCDLVREPMAFHNPISPDRLVSFLEALDQKIRDIRVFFMRPASSVALWVIHLRIHGFL